MRQPEHVAADQQPVYIVHYCEINHFGLYNGFITTGIFLTGIFLAGERAPRVSFLLGKGPRGYPHLGTLEGGQTAPGGASVHLDILQVSSQAIKTTPVVSVGSSCV